MKKIKYLLLVVISAFFVSACEDFVTDVEPPIDSVSEEDINSPDQLPFFVKGIETKFANSVDELFVCSDGLSDAFIFDNNVPNATYSQFIQIDAGDILLNNSNVGSAFDPLGECRYLADRIISRTKSFAEVDSTVRENALYAGFLYGGISRYLYAAYFGLSENRGGGAIDAGPFVDSPQMYNLAIGYLDSALTHTKSSYNIKLVHSLMARAYLYAGDYPNAAVHAQLGLVAGDKPFQALYNLILDNYWWQQAGSLRSQFVAADRFKAYIDADPNEANRIKLAPILGIDEETVYYYQVMYPAAGSPMNFMTWQENNLMRAELIARGAMAGDALALVNEVRASHEISPLTAAVTEESIYVERDKELFATGARLPDQRRFAGKWHLDANAWHYLPIPLSERNANDNF
jgi:hypothetical protein